ncbi:hypothetical protein Scep_016880 [Stephania cephalantha]|uniref:Uncharacterized protein n=1 Tax=Stephania cephalantha TaxID=152367 RepID=A0AAP0IQF5_9MAGN
MMDSNSIQSLDFDVAHCNKKQCKYQDDYIHRLKAKYFSKKTLYGGNIFDKSMAIDNEIVKSSSWPCTRSFADPIQSFEDHSKSSNSAAETSNNLCNRKYQCKKSSN